MGVFNQIKGSFNNNNNNNRQQNGRGGAIVPQASAAITPANAMAPYSDLAPNTFTQVLDVKTPVIREPGLMTMADLLRYKAECDVFVEKSNNFAEAINYTTQKVHPASVNTHKALSNHIVSGGKAELQKQQTNARTAQSFIGFQHPYQQAALAINQSSNVANMQNDLAISVYENVGGWGA